MKKKNRLQRILAILFERQPKKEERAKLPTVTWNIKMPDGQMLGGRENKRSASRKKNRLIKEGGELLQWEVRKEEH
jgi:hypothetical protein